MAASFIFTWLRTVRSAEISRDAKALSLVLACYANPDGTSCRPGDERLRDDLANSRGKPTDRSIRRWRAELITTGLLAQSRRACSPGRGGGAGRSAEWRLILPGMTGQAGHNESRVMTGQLRHPHSAHDRTAGDVLTGQGATYSQDSRSTPTYPRDLPKTFPGQIDVGRSATGGSGHTPPDLIDLVRQEIRRATGRDIDDDWAIKTINLLLGAANGYIANPSGYIRQAICDEPDPRTRFLPITRPGYR
jgi:hypothetical protein